MVELISDFGETTASLVIGFQNLKDSADSTLLAFTDLRKTLAVLEPYLRGADRINRKQRRCQPRRVKQSAWRRV